MASLTWLQKNPSYVEWGAPKYTGDSFTQIGVVQNVNVAGRRDRNIWYVVQRHTDMIISVLEEFPSQSQAQSDAKRRQSTGVGQRSSPFLLSLLLAGWPITQCFSGLSNSDARSCVSEYEISIQALVPHDAVVCAWREPDNDYLQVYDVTHEQFLPDVYGTERLRACLSEVLHSGVFVGVLQLLGRGAVVFYVYDDIAEQAEANLTERLLRLQNQISRGRRDYLDCVQVAPFQHALTKQDIKLHSEIFMAGFTGVVYRRSTRLGKTSTPAVQQLIPCSDTSTPRCGRAS